MQEIKRFWPCVVGIAVPLYLIGLGCWNYGNYGDSAFNYRSAGAIPEILDFPNLVHCHRNSKDYR